MIGQPYLGDCGAPRRPSSPEAAVGSAAATVLRALYRSADRFIDERAAVWSAMVVYSGESAAAVVHGEAFGTAVGQAILAERKQDGAADDDGTYTPLGIAGTHRADPFAIDQGFRGPRWGKVRPFGLADLAAVSRGFVPPLGLAVPGAYRTSRDFAAQLAEVRRYGGAAGMPDVERNAEQTTIGRFWSYDGAHGIGTAPRLYNQCVRRISAQCELTISQNAILFALINMAMADACIAAWEEKYLYHVARPVVGVREAAAGFGSGEFASAPTFARGTLPLPVPTTSEAVAAWLATQPATPDGNVGDPQWRPLGVPQAGTLGRTNQTPPSPSYPSGHAAFGAACFGAVFEFLTAADAGAVAKDPQDLVFELASDELDARTSDADGGRRTSHRRGLTLAQAIHENALAHVYLGVQWPMDAVEGLRLGSDVLAKLLAAARGPASALKTMRPVRHVDGADLAARAVMPTPLRAFADKGAARIRRVAGRK
jgi:hypothetical protein